jgi:hypothetical protein
MTTVRDKELFHEPPQNRLPHTAPEGASTNHTCGMPEGMPRYESRLLHELLEA